MFFSFTPPLSFCIFFFFNDTATTEIYTLSLHDALPISLEDRENGLGSLRLHIDEDALAMLARASEDRKSTRLNSSHLVISYAVFCLKKKKKYMRQRRPAYTQWQTTRRLE